MDNSEKILRALTLSALLQQVPRTVSKKLMYAMLHDLSITLNEAELADLEEFYRPR